jgi:hypothetical protein
VLAMLIGCQSTRDTRVPIALDDEAGVAARLYSVEVAPGRGSHSFTSQLNLSAFYGIGVRVGVV